MLGRKQETLKISTEMRLAFLKSLQICCATSDDICKAIEACGLIKKINIEEDAEQKSQPVISDPGLSSPPRELPPKTTKTKRILNLYLTQTSEAIQELYAFLKSDEYKNSSPEKRNQIFYSGEPKEILGRLENGTLDATRCVTSAACRLSLAHLFFKDMVAIIGLEYQAKQLILDTPPETPSKDPTIRAVTEEFHRFPTASSKARQFRRAMDRCAEEEIKTLLSEEKPLLGNDLEMHTSFGRALSGRIGELEQTLQQEHANSFKGRFAKLTSRFSSSAPENKQDPSSTSPPLFNGEPQPRTLDFYSPLDDDEKGSHSLTYQRPSEITSANIDNKIQEAMKTLLDNLAQPTLPLSTLITDVRTSENKTITVSKRIASEEIDLSKIENDNLKRTLNTEGLELRTQGLKLNISSLCGTLEEIVKQLVLPASKKDSSQAAGAVEIQEEKSPKQRLKETLETIKAQCGEAPTPPVAEAVEEKRTPPQETLLTAARTARHCATEIAHLAANSKDLLSIAKVQQSASENAVTEATALVNLRDSESNTDLISYFEEKRKEAKSYLDTSKNNIDIKQLKKFTAFVDDPFQQSYTGKDQQVITCNEHFSSRPSVTIEPTENAFTMPPSIETCFENICQLENLLQLKGRGENLPLAIINALPTNHIAFSNVIQKLLFMTEMLQRAGASKAADRVIRLRTAISQHLTQRDTALSQFNKIDLSLVKSFIKNIVLPIAAFFSVALGLFYSSLHFGLAEENSLFVTSFIVANPWVGILLATVGIALITQLISQKSDSPIERTPFYQAKKIAENVQSGLFHNALFSTELSTQINIAIKGLNTIHYGLAYLTSYGENRDPSLLKNTVRADLWELNKICHKYSNDGKLEQQDVETLRRIFTNIQSAEIDTTRKPPYSFNEKEDFNKKIAISVLAAGLMFLCIDTLFAILTTAPWIDTLGMTGSMLLTVSSGLLSWLATKSLLNHTNTKPFSELVALLIPFGIATGFIFYSNSWSLLGSWSAAFIIPNGLLFIAAVGMLGTYIHNRKNSEKTTTVEIEEKTWYRLANHIGFGAKVTLAIMLMLLTSFFAALILNISNFAGVDNLLGFAFNQVAMFSNRNLGAPWLITIVLGAFTTTSFTAFLLIKDITQTVFKNETRIKKAIKFVFQQSFTISIVEALYFLKSNFPAEANTALFIPFLIVVSIMPFLTEKVSSKRFPNFRHFYNSCLGIGLLGAGKKKYYAGREVGVFVLLAGISIALSYLIATPDDFMLTMVSSVGGAFMTNVFRVGKIWVDWKDFSAGQKKSAGQGFVLIRSESLVDDHAAARESFDPLEFSPPKRPDSTEDSSFSFSPTNQPYFGPNDFEAVEVLSRPSTPSQSRRSSVTDDETKKKKGSTFFSILRTASSSRRNSSSNSVVRSIKLDDGEETAQPRKNSSGEEEKTPGCSSFCSRFWGGKKSSGTTTPLLSPQLSRLEHDDDAAIAAAGNDNGVLDF